VVVPNKGAEAVLEPETVSDPEVEVESEPGECGTGIDGRDLVGVGMAPVLVPPWPGMRPVDLDGRRMPFGIDAVGIKAVLPVPVDVTPSRESTPDTRPPTKSPEVVVPVGVVDGGLEAEAGTLIGIVGELEASEDRVALVLLPVEDLSPRPKRSERSDPELVVLEAALLILLTLEPVGVAETELFVVDSPKRPPNPEVRSPSRPSLEDAAGVEEAGEVILADESETGVAVEDISAAEDVVVVEDEESPPRRLPTSELKSPRSPSLEVVLEGEVVEALADESTTEPCLLVVPASVDAASGLFLLVFSVLEPSVFCVVVVVVPVGSPPMVVVPVMRWVISGFFGSTEMVTTTTSCPFWG
jgi:hypothetical protein